MTAPFTASNGYTVDALDVYSREDFLVVADNAGVTKHTHLSAFLPRPVLQALVEYAATIGITAPEVATSVDAEAGDDLDRVEALARQMHADSTSGKTWDGLSLLQRVQYINRAWAVHEETAPSEEKSA